MLKDTLVEFNAGMFGQAMFIAAPEIEWRHYLRGVYIQPSTLGGVNIIATDAHRLIYFHDRLGTCSLKRGITIPRKDLRELISMSRKTANINKKITVKFRKLRSGRLKTKRSIYTAKLEKVRNSYVFSPPDGAFPDIQNVIKDQTIDNENNKSIPKCSIIMYKNSFYSDLNAEAKGLGGGERFAKIQGDDVELTDIMLTEV